MKHIEVDEYVLYLHKGKWVSAVFLGWSSSANFAQLRFHEELDGLTTYGKTVWVSSDKVARWNEVRPGATVYTRGTSYHRSPRTVERYVSHDGRQRVETDLYVLSSALDINDAFHLKNWVPEYIPGYPDQVGAAVVGHSHVTEASTPVYQGSIQPNPYETPGQAQARLLREYEEKATLRRGPISAAGYSDFDRQALRLQQQRMLDMERAFMFGSSKSRLAAAYPLSPGEAFAKPTELANGVTPIDALSIPKLVDLGEDIVIY